MEKENGETWIIQGKVVPRPTMDETVSILESRETSTQFSPEDLDSVWREELQRKSLPYIPMSVSKYGHRIGKGDSYADATFRGSSKLPSPYYKVILHPILQYMSENYIRRVMRHEISHIVSDAKRRKPTREALGL